MALMIPEHWYSFVKGIETSFQVVALFFFNPSTLIGELYHLGQKNVLVAKENLGKFILQIAKL
jgi:hypothetical protein